MSLDFPNRKTWLRLRALKPKRPRVLHVSANLIPIYGDGVFAGKLIGYDVAKGVTYRKDAKPPVDPPELTYLPKPVQTAVRRIIDKAREMSWLDL